MELTHEAKKAITKAACKLSKSRKSVLSLNKQRHEAIKKENQKAISRLEIELTKAHKNQHDSIIELIITVIQNGR